MNDAPADVRIRDAAEYFTRSGWSTRSRTACDYFTGRETAISVEAERGGRLIRLSASVDLLSGEWHDVATVDGRRVELDVVLLLVGRGPRLASRPDGGL